MGVISDLLGAGGQAAAAYLPYEAAGQTMADLQSAANQYTTGAQALGQTASAPVQFTPFSVRTASGGTTNVGAGGGYEQTLGTQEQALMNSLFGQANTMAGQATPTGDQLYQQMLAAQAPEQERQRLALENRLAAQGRLGVGTNMYGGTPEELSLNKAIAEQNTNAWLQAQQLAPQLASANTQNIQGLLGAAYTPQQMGLAALTPAAQFGNIQAGLGTAESEALYKTGIAGLQGQAEAQKAISNLESARVNALADALGGLFAKGSTTVNADGTTSTSGGGWLTDVLAQLKL